MVVSFITNNIFFGGHNLPVATERAFNFILLMSLSY
jgi:hypothetical protein